MNVEWDKVGDIIFGILKGNGAHIKMMDDDKKETIDPHDATKFIAEFKSKDTDLKSYFVIVDIHREEDSDAHIDLKTPKLKNHDDFELMKQIKNSMEKESLTINWSRVDKVITPKPDTENESITESKDIGKVYGTTKSSFQRVGECKIIIRHSDPVDESKQGSRWRKIRAVFVETKDGERFKCSSLVAEARALARHLSNQGTIHDEIAESIRTLGSDYLNLKRGVRTLNRSGDEESKNSLREIMRESYKRIKRLSGPRGYSSLVGTLKNHIISEDNDNILSLHKQLMEKCDCTDSESDEAKSLLVAARHLTEYENTKSSDTNEIEFIRQPDIFTKASGQSDQKKRLVWQVRELADSMKQSEIKKQLEGIAIDLEDNRPIEDADIELVRKVFVASNKMINATFDSNSPVMEQDTTLNRIRTLSGLKNKFAN